MDHDEHLAQHDAQLQHLIALHVKMVDANERLTQAVERIDVTLARLTTTLEGVTDLRGRQREHAPQHEPLVMYNHAKAEACRVIVPCAHPLQEPVTVSGTYRCQEDHLHQVIWRDGRLTVSSLGYESQFYRALQWGMKLAAGQYDVVFQPLEYTRVVGNVLRQHGYGSVLDTS